MVKFNQTFIYFHAPCNHKSYIQNQQVHNLFCLKYSKELMRIMEVNSMIYADIFDHYFPYFKL